MKNADPIQNFFIHLELISELKINKEKCCLYGMNIVEARISVMAEKLQCRNDKFSFKYLGLSMSNRLKKAMRWNYIVQKIRNRIKR